MCVFYNPNVNKSMFIKIESVLQTHARKSKWGKVHTFRRRKNFAIFECDNCRTEFTRPKSGIDPKRLNDHYAHVCPKCDPKRFAQKKGVEKRKKLDKKAKVSAVKLEMKEDMTFKSLCQIISKHINKERSNKKTFVISILSFFFEYLWAINSSGSLNVLKVYIDQDSMTIQQSDLNKLWSLVLCFLFA